uniref:KxDL domain-containing protein n=1 Tax=Meloidogyne floridensis TaxID=298350 RepID=A0A915P8Q8_9BILA
MSTEIPKQSSLESSKISSDGSPPREENFIESLNSQVDKSNIEEIIKTQKRSLERFEKTNEMLGNCCILAEKRLEKAKKEFASNKEQILQAKQDLDFIFRKIFNLKKILAKEYPKEYEEEENLKMIKKQLKGPLFFAFSVVFSVGTISAVLWDIERQKDRRTETVRYRMQQTSQQYQNLAEYMEQKQKFEDYKRNALMANRGNETSTATQQKPSGLFGDRSAQKPSGLFGDRSAQKPSGLFGDRSAQKPSGLFGDRSAQKPSGLFADRSAQKPSGLFGDRSAQKPSGLFADRSAQKPSGLFGDRSAQKPSGLFADRSAKAAVVSSEVSFFTLLNSQVLSARYRMQQTAQQYQNLAEYMEQKQKFEDYKRNALMANRGNEVK